MLPGWEHPTFAEISFFSRGQGDKEMGGQGERLSPGLGVSSSPCPDDWDVHLQIWDAPA